MYLNIMRIVFVDIKRLFEFVLIMNWFEMKLNYRSWELCWIGCGLYWIPLVEFVGFFFFNIELKDWKNIIGTAMLRSGMSHMHIFASCEGLIVPFIVSINYIIFINKFLVVMFSQKKKKKKGISTILFFKKTKNSKQNMLNFSPPMLYITSEWNSELKPAEYCGVLFLSL